jgi:outer membrane protein assembly factor BamB
VYVTGDTSGRLKGEIDRKGSDAFARLLSPEDGTTIWTHQFGTSGDDVSYGAFLSGGELYAVGTTSGAFGDQVSAGDSDAFVQAIDVATGAKIWTHQFGTDRSDYAYADWVAGGAVYVVGGTRGAFAGSQRLGSGDAFVTRIDGP